MTEKRKNFFQRPGPVLFGLLLITLVYLAGVLVAPAWLIGTSEYQWPVLRHGIASRIPAAALVMALAAASGLLLSLNIEQIIGAKHGKLKAYLGLFLIGAAFQLGPAAVHRYGLIELPLRAYLPDHTSYFADAARLPALKPWLVSWPKTFDRLEQILGQVRAAQKESSPPDEMRRLWDQANQILHPHSRTHPPGAVAAGYGVQELARRLPGFSAAYFRFMPRSEEAQKNFSLDPAQVAAGGLWALIMILIAAGAAPITFALCRIIMNNQSAALAALLFISAPAFAHKAPVLDHLLGVIILLALWLTLSAAVTRESWRVCLAGVILGCGMWLGLTMLAGLALCIFFAGASFYKYQRKGARLRDLALLFGTFSLVIISCAVAGCFGLGLIFRLNFVEVYQNVSDIGWNLNNLASGRVQAWKWIAFNFYEVFAFAGLPLAALFIAAVIKQARALIRRDFIDLDPWLIAAVAFLLALDLSTKVCYEASRLCWFCFPIIALAAARTLSKQTQKTRTIMIAVIIALQIVSTLVFRMVF